MELTRRRLIVNFIRCEKTAATTLFLEHLPLCKGQPWVDYLIVFVLDTERRLGVPITLVPPNSAPCLFLDRLRLAEVIFQCLSLTAIVNCLKLARRVPILYLFVKEQVSCLLQLQLLVFVI